MAHFILTYSNERFTATTVFEAEAVPPWDTLQAYAAAVWGYGDDPDEDWLLCQPVTILTLAEMEQERRDALQGV